MSGSCEKSNTHLRLKIIKWKTKRKNENREPLKRKKLSMKKVIIIKLYLKDSQLYSKVINQCPKLLEILKKHSFSLVLPSEIAF